MLVRGVFGGGAASGSAGSIVASRNSGGQYLRARVTPTNTSTTQQQEARNAVRILSPRWSSGLTQVQRDGWEVFAENVKRKNRIGDSINISGISTYVGFNQPRIQAGLAIVDDAPGTFDTGDAGTPAVLAIGAGGTVGSITFTAADDWFAGGSLNHALVYVSRPQNPGKRFFKGPFQLASTIAGGGTVTTKTFTLPFPTAGSLTQRVFAQYRITRSDGRLSSPIAIETLTV